MKKITLFLGLLLSLVLVSCNEVKEARDVATTFYEYRQSGENYKATDLVSKEFLENTSKEEFVDVLNYIDDQLGEITAYNSSNFNIKTVNGKKLASFVYKVEYDKGTMKDSLVFIKEDDTYKLLYYQYETVK